MNITGGFNICEDNAATYSVIMDTTGAFGNYQVEKTRPLIDSILNTPYKMQHISFNAANSWTGTTGMVGGNSIHNNIQPYITVNIWRRIS